jgi:hypothetical protein
MGELCGEKHPQDPTVVCDKTAPCWEYHANALAHMTWPGRPLPPSPAPSRATGSIKGRLALMAQRAQR